ncbi:hypothetical protein D3C76_1139790 [compost metagenome]
MKGTTVADPQTQGSDFRPVDVDTRCIGLGRGGDTVTGQQLDQALLHPADQIAHAKPELAHVQQQISHQLAGAVVGHLTTTVDLHHRNITGKQQMLGLAGLALGEHRRVFHQPDLVGGIVAAFVGEALHGMPDRLVSHLAELAKAQHPGHHSTMCTKPVARSSLLMLYSWSWSVATMCN